ncbi:hypothetical protein [Salipiger thiooxidans]|uniref:hypothetical protein n=1 Tax=Salipiger thiooxidans TaxID=282683 RepID=UPI001CD7C06C|nr:hypothetical protein [Salipiger thiooxidans]MCA0850838.1 hypothetical protein [Salipiger thiooxidans]
MVAAFSGGLLLCLVIWDILMSALGTGSSGPIAPRVARTMFGALRKLPESGAVHRSCGPIVTAAIGAVWIVLMCLGWTLVFSATQAAVVQSSTNQPAGMLGRITYAGHLLSTLGGGLNQPGGQGWGAAAMLAGVSGMIILTLSVSFVYSTTQAVATGRAVIALSDIHGPGTEQFDSVLLPQIATLVAQIKAIPFSLYYSTVRDNRRLPASLAKLYRHPQLTSDAQARLRVLLCELPGLEGTEAEAFEQRFYTWVDTYSIGGR